VLEDPEDPGNRLFIKAKNNIADVAVKGLRYHFGTKTVGHDAKLKTNITALHIVWMDHVDISANEAMQAADGRSGSALREARDFLLEHLEAGPAKADEIFEEAKQNGINQKTLKRAKKDLGVRSRKEQGKIGGQWLWELPKGAKGGPQ
jgi:putative DNA primase/helicase